MGPLWQFRALNWGKRKLARLFFLDLIKEKIKVLVDCSMKQKKKLAFVSSSWNILVHQYFLPSPWPSCLVEHFLVSCSMVLENHWMFHTKTCPSPWFISKLTQTDCDLVLSVPPMAHLVSMAFSIWQRDHKFYKRPNIDLDLLLGAKKKGLSSFVPQLWEGKIGFLMVLGCMVKKVEQLELPTLIDVAKVLI